VSVDTPEQLEGLRSAGRVVAATLSALRGAVAPGVTTSKLDRVAADVFAAHGAHPFQEETFVVLSGTLSMYLGEPPERRDVPAGGLVHVAPGTPLQTVNHGSVDLLVYAYGTPPESENAELLASAV
jgi:mannose-6-phosphate isomerase-like protein (cupin superfamily)